MASKFVILLNGQIVERIYTGSADEQFAAYDAEFPIGSGANLRYTMATTPAEPLVVLG